MHTIEFIVFSSYDEFSWKKATQMLVEVANYGEATGYEVPCLMVSVKDDLDTSPISIQESTSVGFLLKSESMKINRILHTHIFMNTVHLLLLLLLLLYDPLSSPDHDVVVFSVTRMQFPILLCLFDD